MDAPNTVAARPTTIELTPHEIQSGHDRVRWAEDLIAQLPPHHEGRNSWLLNYGVREESEAIRAAHARGEYYGGPFKPETAETVTASAERRQFEMTPVDYDGLMAKINAARNTPLIMLHCGSVRSLQEVANDAWAELGKRMGFEHMTVQGTAINPRFFSAVPVAPTDSLRCEAPADCSCLARNADRSGCIRAFPATGGEA